VRSKNDEVDGVATGIVHDLSGHPTRGDAVTIDAEAAWRQRRPRIVDDPLYILEGGALELPDWRDVKRKGRQRHDDNDPQRRGRRQRELLEDLRAVDCEQDAHGSSSLWTTHGVASGLETC